MWVNLLQSAVPACAAAFAADAPVTATSARLRVLRVCGSSARCGLWVGHLVSYMTARSDTMEEVSRWRATARKERPWGRAGV